jgi:hypothetical protein
VLGDAAAEVFGPDFDIARIVALGSGDPPCSPQERDIQPLIRDAFAALGKIA